MVESSLTAEMIGDLLTLAFETSLTVGAGSRFREYEEFRQSTLALIEILDRRGAPVSGHLLSAARFEALLANGDRTRRDLITRAVAASRTADERIRALLTQSRARTDVSDYRGAQQALAECAELLEDETAAEWRPEYQHSLGLTYYYSDPVQAAHHFEESVRLGRPLLDRLGTSQPVASSLHFLGRAAAERGEFDRALRLYVEAEATSDDYLSGHGFYHQRMAEVLIDHGSTEEAEFHLRRSQQTFDQVGQQSHGMALLFGTWSRFYVRTGQLGRAEKALAEGIDKSRREKGPRVELVLLAQKLHLRLRQRRLAGLALLMARAAWLYLREELVRNPLQAVRQAIVVARQSRHLLRSSNSGGRVLVCPCGEDHRSRAADE
ncbi:tetratricopeptide repeat protein [Streptomyces sp. NPDC001980]|uniref:tetratricopeptide repeat protein n=1 Tax=Streptomyces sp. NPDC001980 TaxID=3157126 RepID=UPI00332DF041